MRDDLRDEALAFRDPLHLNRDRVDRLLEPLEALRRIVPSRRHCRTRRPTPHNLRQRHGQRSKHEDDEDDRDAGELARIDVESSREAGRYRPSRRSQRNRPTGGRQVELELAEALIENPQLLLEAGAIGTGCVLVLLGQTGAALANVDDLTRYLLTPRP